jgi:vacuolar-type H+-ATPase subunit F/Vma7
MIKKIEKAIKRFGILYVTQAMGYKTPSTLRHWIRKQEVPILAHIRVEKFLEEHKS